MQGILIIVVWTIVVITAIAGYFVWENAKKLTSTTYGSGNMSEYNKDVVNRYGYLRIITIFILIGLFVIAVVSFLEASETQNYFKF